MKRREAIKFSAISLGMILERSLSTSLIRNTLKAFYTNSVKLKHFTEQEISFLISVIDTILPKTESPSSSEAGTHFLMDSIIAEIMSDNERENFTTNFNALKTHLASENFSSLSSKNRVELLSNILKKGSFADNPGFWGLNNIREMSINLYLSTEKIGEEYLNYLPVPGMYDPCINLEQVDNKRWAI